MKSNALPKNGMAAGPGNLSASNKTLRFLKRTYNPTKMIPKTIQIAVIAILTLRHYSLKQNVDKLQVEWPNDRFYFIFRFSIIIWYVYSIYSLNSVSLALACLEKHSNTHQILSPYVHSLSAPDGYDNLRWILVYFEKYHMLMNNSHTKKWIWRQLVIGWCFHCNKQLFGCNLMRF